MKILQNSKGEATHLSSHRTPKKASRKALKKMTVYGHLRSWSWMFLFIALVAITTERALKRVREERNLLSTQLISLKEEKKVAMKVREKLTKQINSQSDPAWIELVLKRELGLVPEGQTKVLFTQ